MTSRLGAGLLASVLVLAACSSADDTADVATTGDAAASEAASSGTSSESEADGPSDAAEPASVQRYAYPDPPAAPDADAENPDADAAIERILDVVGNGFFDAGGVTALTETADPRHAWFLSDLLRFFGGTDAEQLVGSFETITGVSVADDPDLERSPWLSVTNHMIAWDTPAYPGYQADKGVIFTLLEDGWKPFFADTDAEIDWRHISWGGVFIDDRPLGDPNGCPGGCIPALDDPATTDAAGGDWYPDERTVFGVEVDGEALAIPLNIAEIHEMFNLTLGGRRIGIPYCTLCGSAQAYFIDTPSSGIEDPIVLRTTGLLNRSNKVMYDLPSKSVFDTFIGDAVSGPLQDAGVVLEQITTVRSTWGEWKADHPDTQIIAEDGGIGRTYELDPLGDRDADGPIFPIGDADDRLDVRESVVGVIAPDGTTAAFPSEAATAALDAGDDVEIAGVELRASGDGLIAIDAASGDTVVAHEAFWFAWSQFHPDTLLWEP